MIAMMSALNADGRFCHAQITSISSFGKLQGKEFGGGLYVIDPSGGCVAPLPVFETGAVTPRWFN
jgi:hypothetical protein